ncbi:helicase [Fadolivirus algeromassiliense]|jgi:superfamily II DNA or RNA helicase|uniref:Helicase n=1 Tax=Fadolivirus FV1/VV64 TaxID=3070911 RepID=A0A7D3QWX2_9VIRU|nr:helicase [Fadolivirus algeromassiliense]QKF93860.1 helicase [Fadolivirus FV1/VV64]
MPKNEPQKDDTDVIQKKKTVKSIKQKQESLTIDDVLTTNNESNKQAKPIKQAKSTKKAKSAKQIKPKVKKVIIDDTDELIDNQPQKEIVFSQDIKDILSKNGSVLSRYGYVIKKDKLTQIQLNKLRAELTVTPKADSGYGGDVESFPVFRENDDTITIPRYYGLRKFGKPEEKFNTSDSQVDFEFYGKLRENQVEVAKVVLEKLQSQGGGLLQLHTGYGKTTMAIYLASVLKLKTLVIVHKTFLQDQWYDRIKQFTNASIGMIRQKKVDVEGKDIVIGMLQSISMIDYDPEIFKDFNLVITDETHHMGSRVFSRALSKICPKYTIGLSATPHRADGLMKVVKWYLGEILVKVERKGDNAVYIKSFDYKTDDVLFEEKKRWIPGARQSKPDTVKMITNMYKMENRNKFIVNIINGLRKKDERKTLVLSGRIEHLKMLKQGIDELIAKDVADGLCDQDEIKTSFYIGGMKDYQLKDSAESDILFATYSMAEEGLDIDGLNTLILATPKKNIIQSIGRIMRKPIQEGDVNPLIIDIIDDLSCFKSWGDQRIKYYKSKNYTINSYKAFNDNLITYKDYMIQEGLIKQEDITPEFDPREYYIKTRYGADSFKFEKRIGFKNFPDEMFNYNCDYVEIFEINHDFTKTDHDEPKIEIDLDPKIEIEI